MSEVQRRKALEDKLSQLHGYLVKGEGTKLGLELKTLEGCLETNEDKIDSAKQKNHFF